MGRAGARGYQFALTLVTPRGKLQRVGRARPGMFGVHRARTDHVQGLPETTYGPAQSIRPGDLANSDSGQAAMLVRKRWAELVAGGQDPHRRRGQRPVGRDTSDWAVLAAVDRCWSVLSVPGALPPV